MQYKIKIVPSVPQVNIDERETEWRIYSASFFEESLGAGLTESEIDICLAYAKPIFERGLPIIYDYDHFSSLVGYKLKYIRRAAKAPANFYRNFTISKRSGRPRTISEPLPSLKEIQLWLLRNLLDRMPVHPTAKAYVVGRSIKNNARFHRGQQRVLTVDVKDFFPSISSDRIEKILVKAGYSPRISSLIANLCCLNGKIPQGSPTSPAISNIVCFDMDEEFFQYARSRKLRYTRYADDMTFSGDFIRHSDIKYIYRTMKSHGFDPNLEKTRLMRSHQRQQITGIVVNNHLQVGREYRRELRQHAYFIDRFGIEEHAAVNKITHIRFKDHLLGRANHVLHVNAGDKDAMKLKELLKRS